MKKLAILPAAALLLALVGCGNKIHQIGPADSMELKDFTVYQDGESVMDLQAKDCGNFCFSWAADHGMEIGTLHTQREVAVGDSDYEILKQYGGILCQVDYKFKGLWYTQYDTTFADYYGGSQYQKEYVVTFYAFLERGRLQKPNGEDFIALYADKQDGLEIYGLSFTVKGGVIRDIECYAHTLDN